MDLKSITTLNRLRGTYKTKLTRIKTFVENFQPSEDVVEAQVALTAKLEALLEIKTGLNELCTDYTMQPDTVDISQPLAALSELDVETEQLEVSLKTFLSKLQVPPVHPSTPAVSLTDSKPTLKFRLPEVPLPTFSGQVLQFSNFKQQFTSVISQCKDLTDIQKLFYLRAALKGDVQLIQTEQDTFESLWNALEARYDNRRTIVDAHSYNILNYPRISESPSQLRLFLDTIRGNLRALKLLNLDRNSLSDHFMLCLFLTRIDAETRKEYELTLKTNTLPTLDQFFSFIEGRIRILEGLTKLNHPSNRNSSTKTNSHTGHASNTRQKTLVVSNQKSPSDNCVLCGDNCSPHPLFRCQKFKSMSVPDRFQFVKKEKKCISCLSSNHFVSKCASAHRCAVKGCAKMHHTLLHRENIDVANNSHDPKEKKNSHLSNESPSTSSRVENVNTLPVTSQVTLTAVNEPGNSYTPTHNSCCSANLNSVSEVDLFTGNERKETRRMVLKSESDASFSCYSGNKEKQILLNTAIVYLIDHLGKKHGLRTILDSASQNNVLASHVVKSLGLVTQRVQIPIVGINGEVLNITSKVSANITNAENDVVFPIDMLVVKKIAEVCPSRYIDISALNIPKGIPLADKNFHKPKNIDLLLSAEYFFDYLREGKINLEGTGLNLKNSCFGYLVSGSIDAPPTHPPHATFVNTCFLTSNLDKLSKEISAFWQIEEISSPPEISDELKFCEDHYARTHTRKSDGRYLVTLPFKPNCNPDSALGDSRWLAEKRLNQLYVRFGRDPNLKGRYSDFLAEYEKLGHMRELTGSEYNNDGYFFCHHGVWKESSQTTKLRVVFNGSAKTPTGYSLNDLLLKGGVIQNELFNILLRFRKHLFAFTCDIKMMFRQIDIVPEQHKYQKILWKNSLDAPVKMFSLTTIAYGTSPASYLSTRTLHQLALDERETFPQAAEIVDNDFYMDDCLSGAPSRGQLLNLKDDLVQMFSRAGMQLHKWCSNVDLSASTPSTFPVPSNDASISKTLGMLWDPGSDSFSYKVDVSPSEKISKRDVLSQIASQYDPLGLLGPTICLAKIFMQSLWLQKLSWHEPLPSSVIVKWNHFLNKLLAIQNLQIPRCVVASDTSLVVLHGFADSSEKAFGAVVYLQSVSNDGKCKSQLLCSKSRVAPLKCLTIPRLELQACLLLSKLVTKVIDALKLNIDDVKLYSDSTISLSWIKTPPHQLKQFVSNRVVQIVQLTKQYKWFHVQSGENPADPLSRGLDGESLVKNAVWWSGPPFLLNDTTSTSVQCIDSIIDESAKAEHKANSDSSLIVTTSNSFFERLYDTSNNYTRLISVLVYILRFVHNSRWPDNKRLGQVSPMELSNARDTLVRHAQSMVFAEELRALSRGQSVSSSSKLRFLNPFLDSAGLIRIGGRLTNADISYERKHPLILPDKCKLSKIIFDHFHKKELHTGPQALLHTVRQVFWPLNGRTVARQVVHSCITCFRAKPVALDQIMGDLPPVRVRPSPPFSNCGIDLCGPFTIKFKNQRKGTYQKTFVAIFVCMATKAVHFEAVSDLSADTFIAALKRFFSRRSKSSILFSDNATNFSGANSELQKLLKIVNSSKNPVLDFLSSEGVVWKFIPPRGPNFGGIWEAGVRSFKHHLKRVIGVRRLTLEEFLTVIVQIEGILNSRPLSPLSTEPDNLEVLTPGHFLIGQPINVMPEPDLIDTKDNLLDRWQRTQKLVQTIWKNWENSYLSHLQQRGKWLFAKPNLLPGMLVIVKDPQVPVCNWITGRIVTTFPGRDSKVRVVEIKTAKGNMKRPISRVCLLPIVDNAAPSVPPIGEKEN